MSRLLIYSDRGGVYGAEQINHRLAIGLQAAGLELTLAQPKADNILVAERAAHGIGHHWLPDEDPYDWRHPAPSFSDPRAAECCFDRTQPDLILFADSFPFASLAAKQAAAGCGIPYLTLIHCVQPGWAGQYGTFLPRLAEAFGDARGIVAVSTENLTLLRSDFGLPEGGGQVIFNGRPEVYFKPRSSLRRQRMRAELGIPADAIVALSIGRLELVKGWQHLLDALRSLRHCQGRDQLHLVWVGSGSLERQVRRVSGLLGQGKVQLLPVSDRVPALLDTADLLIHPARFEGMPLVVLEAMAKGLPVIATVVSGIPEALGDTGVLLQPREDGTPLGERIATTLCALAGDQPRRQRLGTAARERALACFTEARMIKEYLLLVQRELKVR